MSSLDREQTGPAYWRSLSELADTPEFREALAREFPSVAAGLDNASSRRQFLKLMGASLALAGMTGCRRWPEKKLAPYTARPEGLSPGVPQQYATTLELGGFARPVLATSYDGRPIKIEGNPSHPASAGAADALTQAGVLQLYDPDRGSTVVHRTGGGAINTDWDAFIAFARKHYARFRAEQGAGLAVLCEATESPSVAAMKARLLEAFPQAGWFEYEPVSFDNDWLGSKLAFGRPLRMDPDLEQADIIACFDADILVNHPSAIRNARGFAAGRSAPDNGKKMNRLYVAETTYTVTGAAADHRLATGAFAVRRLVQSLAEKLEVGSGASSSLIESIPGPGVKGPNGSGEAPADGFHGPFVETLVRDLKTNRGRSVLVAGPGQPPEVHALCHLMNHKLGNIGKTVRYLDLPDGGRPSHLEAIESLTTKMDSGQVQSLLILGGNPVYNGPGRVGFAQAIRKVPVSVHLGDYDDETSQACTWHLPRAHYLEAWGDARSWDGTISLIQPLIEPLYGGRSIIETLATVLDERPAAGYEIVRRTAKQYLPTGDFEETWRKALHDGVVEGSGYEAVRPTPRSAKITITVEPADHAERPGLEITFMPAYGVYDGRFANNGWLQELPDPMTKLTWDNAALMSVSAAKRFEVQTGDVVTLSVGQRKVEMPVYVMPGQAAASITLYLGYGRRRAGAVGNDVGVDVYPLLPTDGTNFQMGGMPQKTGRTYRLAGTQDHHLIDTVGMKARGQRVGKLIREASLDHYQAEPDFAKHATHTPELKQLWEDPLEYDGHRWAMAIDLNRCIGCNACVVACQAENNVPVVGKDQVAVGREMHWIRVDRYFKGEVADPQVACQPLTCHQCENAPCEQVCPVAATVHDSDGLNVMVYNRCVGTRYCSNNCPYKVRRFNYFDYHSKPPRQPARPYIGMPDAQQRDPQRGVGLIKRMVFNPEVTVRSRGVMEKCTFCTQRIQAAKIRAKLQDRPIADGQITPACAQTCPTQAIVFGDLNDPDGRVRKAFEHPRAYGILEELNVRPRTRYLAKLRNPAGGEAAGKPEQTERQS